MVLRTYPTVATVQSETTETPRTTTETAITIVFMMHVIVASPFSMSCSAIGESRLLQLFFYGFGSSVSPSMPPCVAGAAFAMDAAFWCRLVALFPPGEKSVKRLATFACRAQLFFHVISHTNFRHVLRSRDLPSTALILSQKLEPGIVRIRIILKYPRTHGFIEVLLLRRLYHA